MTEQQQATWDEATAMFQAEREERKLLRFPLKNGKVLTFEYRQLTQQESDLCEAVLSKIQKSKDGKGAEINLPLGEFKLKIISYGVTKGPHGFSAKNIGHVRQLPAHVRDELAEAIEKFSQMEEEEERLFFRGREGREER